MSPGFDAARQAARTARDHESKNLFYVALTRARDLVVTSATAGRSPAGWFKELEPLIGNTIPAIPYSALRTAAGPSPVFAGRRPTAPQMEAALAALPPAPAAPALQRIPATRLAESAAVDADTFRHVRSAANATALGSLGHAVLEQLALNGWEGAADDWLQRLYVEFGIGRAEAAALAPRIEQARSFMAEETADALDIRPELPFVLHEGNRLIDGTMDLLCRYERHIILYDYKFTDADDRAVLDTYRGQMELYGQAAARAYPEAAEIKLMLMAIASGGVRLIPVHFQRQSLKCGG
jgi:ATP-dependent helicase/nuclease subunit A